MKGRSGSTVSNFVELTDLDEEEILDLNEWQSNNTVASVPVPPVALQERHPLEFTVILIGSTLLSFNAGFVNGCTYQARNIPVSHVTGTTTHAGMNLGNDDWNDFAVNFAIICSFVFGSSITGFYMPQNSFQLGREYGPLFIVGSVLFSLACMTSYKWPESNYYFYFAAMACGLQNAMTSKYSGNIIRTTHMTGTATDIGVVLGRICTGETKELWKLYTLCPIFVSFLCGGIISVPVFKQMGKLSLLINVLVFFSIGLAYSIVIGRQMHIPFWKAFFGCYSRIEKKIKKGSAKVKHAVDHMQIQLHDMTSKSPLHSAREETKGESTKKDSDIV